MDPESYYKDQTRERDTYIQKGIVPPVMRNQMRHSQLAPRHVYSPNFRHDYVFTKIICEIKLTRISFDHPNR